MNIIPSRPYLRDNGFPTSDGKPMGETDGHRILMGILIETLDEYYAAQPRVYVSGNLLIFYEPGNRRRHVSPDVFVVHGVEKRRRPNYLLWEERRAPQVVIELTSSTTHREDMGRKFTLYQDTLRVREYFLFDPTADYLDPPLRGYRLRQGAYRPIRAVHGRLASQVLRLHLERDGENLRLWNPLTQGWLATPAEVRQQAEQARIEAEQARIEAEQARIEAEQRAQLAENEAEALRRELEEVRRRSGTGK